MMVFVSREVVVMIALVLDIFYMSVQIYYMFVSMYFAAQLAMVAVERRPCSLRVGVAMTGSRS
jgi:hypothetical protein